MYKVEIKIKIERNNIRPSCTKINQSITFSRILSQTLCIFAFYLTKFQIRRIQEYTGILQS